MVKQVYILVEEGHYFAHHLEFESVDMVDIKTYFRQQGINLEAIKIENSKKISNAIIFTCSSQRPYQKQYIDDILDFMEQKNNRLIPSRYMIKAHENKGFQELYKEILNINSLKAFYVNKSTIDYQKVDIFGYPLVLKKLDGSGSKGVRLINNQKELKKEIETIKISWDIRFLIYLKEKYKKIFLRKQNQNKIEYFKDYQNYVIQEFIPNLKYDYKVLIFFDKYYVLKRYISNNDFRASGSGSFEFTQIDSSLLEYSQKIFNVFDEPFISLDICFDGSKYYLIEYQGIHFGPYTQINSNGFYQKINDKWKFIEKKVSLSEDIAYALYNHLIKLNVF